MSQAGTSRFPIASAGALSLGLAEGDVVDYGCAAFGSVPHGPTSLGLMLSTGGQKLDEGDDRSPLYARIRSCSVDAATGPDLKDVAAGTFGTKLTS